MSTTLWTASGIAYERSGPTGQLPVLLLHAGVADRRMWDAQWPALTRERDAIRLDLRGFGESTRPPASPFTPVGDVAETLAELSITGCHVVGACMGAGVATELALSGSVRVQSLLLCPPGGSLIAGFTPDLRAFVEAERTALARGDVDAAVEANIATWVIGPGRSTSEVDPAVRDAVRRMQRLAFEVGEGWGEEVEEIEVEPAALDRLADLTCPVHVLMGGHDLDAINEAASRLCSGVPGATRTDWPDAAHLPSMEHPQRFLDLLLEWIKPSLGC